MNVDRAAYADAICAAAKRSALSLSDSVKTDVLSFVDYMLDVNRELNLTRIVLPEDVAVKHFEDSWTLLPLLPDGCSLLDIGTGAGFPGFAVKLVRPDIRLTVIESIGKKVRFLTDAAAHVGFDADIRLGRAELLAHDSDLRGQFDVVTARAVASLDMLLEMSLPFVRTGGQFIAMRGQEEAVPTFIGKLGAELTKTLRLILTGDVTRTLYVFTKVSATPKHLPRSLGAMRKRPL